MSNCDSTSGYFPGFDTNEYVSRLYKDLTIGGEGTSVLNSGSFHLAGQDFVLLETGFEVSGSAEVIISTTPCQNDQIRLTESQGQGFVMPKPSVLKDMSQVKILR